MKKLILLIYLITASCFGACSTDSANPNILPTVNITAGSTILWRARVVSPDGNALSTDVNLIPTTYPNWVKWGELIKPDPNVYVFALSNVDCNGVVIDPNAGRVVSRRITISPPISFGTGSSEVRFMAVNGSVITYWRIPIRVTKPVSQQPASDVGIDDR